MSAPNQGRQSPEPEQSKPEQIEKPTGSGSGKMDESSSKDEGKHDQTAGLEDNPEHPLAKASEEKTSKTVS